MAIQHVDIDDPHIHEPKGASSASEHTVYVSDGAGSGSWINLTTDSIQMAGVLSQVSSGLADGSIPVPARLFLTTVIADVSTPSSVIVPLIQDCTVVGATCVLGGAITSADAEVSFTNAAAAGMGTPVTVAFNSSAKGDQYAFTATGNNVITGPSWIEITTDGGSDTAQPLYVTIEIELDVNEAFI